jgi:hypothetical protein
MKAVVMVVMKVVMMAFRKWVPKWEILKVFDLELMLVGLKEPKLGSLKVGLKELELDLKLATTYLRV